jgi:hypothetical protein
VLTEMLVSVSRYLQRIWFPLYYKCTSLLRPDTVVLLLSPSKWFRYLFSPAEGSNLVPLCASLFLLSVERLETCGISGWSAALCVTLLRLVLSVCLSVCHSIAVHIVTPVQYYISRTWHIKLQIRWGSEAIISVMIHFPSVQLNL